MGPKVEDQEQVPGMRYHVKNTPVGGWKYEAVALANVRSTVNLLARILIAKVEDERRLVYIFNTTPVDPRYFEGQPVNPDDPNWEKAEKDPNWRCRSWVRAVLERLKADGRAVGSNAVLDWNRIQALGREYVAQKTQSGRYAVAEEMLLPKPTWDMMEKREIVP